MFSSRMINQCKKKWCNQNPMQCTFKRTIYFSVQCLVGSDSQGNYFDLLTAKPHVTKTYLWLLIRSIFVLLVTVQFKCYTVSLMLKNMMHCHMLNKWKRFRYSKWDKITWQHRIELSTIEKVFNFLIERSSI